MSVQDYLLKEVEEPVKATKQVFVSEKSSESVEQETTDDETLKIKVCLIEVIIDKELIISDWVMN